MIVSQNTDSKITHTSFSDRIFGFIHSSLELKYFDVPRRTNTVNLFQLFRVSGQSFSPSPHPRL